MTHAIHDLSNDELDKIVDLNDRKQVGALDYNEFLSRKLPPRENC